MKIQREEAEGGAVAVDRVGPGFRKLSCSQPTLLGPLFTASSSSQHHPAEGKGGGGGGTHTKGRKSFVYLCGNKALVKNSVRSKDSVLT